MAKVNAFLLVLINASASIIADALSQTTIWEQTNGPYAATVYSIAVHPSGQMFLGSGGAGVYRSLDDGNTWRRTNLDSRIVYRIASSASGLVVALSSGGIFASSDTGSTWSQISRQANGTAVVVNSAEHIFVNKSGINLNQFGVSRTTNHGSSWTDVFFTVASVSDIAVSHTGDLFAGSIGIWRSTDDGDTWNRVPLDNYYIYTIAVDSLNNIYAGTYGSGVFRSTDNGTTWDQVNSGLNDSYIVSIAINTSGIVFAGTRGGGIYRTTNQGANWMAINNGLTILFVSALATHPQGFVFAGGFDGAGVFRTTDSGVQWNQANVGLRNTEVDALVATPSGTVFAGIYGGVFRTSNRGENWVQVNAGLTDVWIHSLAANSAEHLFAGSHDHGVFLSTDWGKTWVARGLSVQRIFGLAVDKYDDIYAATEFQFGGGVFKSSDNGITWSQLYTDVSGHHAIAINSRGYLFSSSYWRIFRSTDHGSTWTQAFDSYPFPIPALAVDPHDHIFAATRGQGVLRSSDDGNTWQPINSGLTDTSFSCIVIHRTAGLFVGANGGGVFRSTNDGVNWTPINNGLSTRDITSLCIDSSDILYAGTLNGGVFRTATPITSVDSDTHGHPIWFALSQNHPNPFNGATTIEYVLSWKTKVELKIYSILGQELRTLLKEEQEEGMHRVGFDAAQFPSGVYFYRLITPEFVATKKMLLIR